MNIFRLDSDPVAAAAMHNDSHIRKMPTEYAQQLSTAVRLCGGKPGRLIHPKRGLVPYECVMDGEECRPPKVYLVTHINHPCNVWTRETRDNWTWLFCLYEAMCAEFERRTGRVHGAFRIRDDLAINSRFIPAGAETAPPLAMPEKYRNPKDPVQSYRVYYTLEKNGYFKEGVWVASTWTNATIPTWYTPSR